MKKIISSRTRAILRNCRLNHESSGDEDHNMQDICENSRSSSPIQLSRDLLGIRTTNTDDVGNELHAEVCCKKGVETVLNSALSSNLLLHNLSNVTKSNPANTYHSFPLIPQLVTNSLVEETSNKMVIETIPSAALLTSESLVNCDDLLTEIAAKSFTEPTLHQVLTPELISSDKPNAEMPDTGSIEIITIPISESLQNRDDLLTETAAEKSIEAPPYSPLTPKPYNGNKLNMEGFKEIVPNETFVASKSILSHDHLLTETSFENTNNFVELLPVSPFSPLPPMSPETTNIVNIFAGSITFNDDVQEIPVASIRDEKIDDAVSLDSHDSVKDPDYIGDDGGYSSNEDSSNNSISLISGTTYVEINQIPKEKAQHRHNECCDSSRGSERGISEVEGEKISGESAIISCDVEPTTINSTIEVSESSQVNEQYLGRPKKGRKRLYGGLSREERKRRKYMNLSYVNSRKSTVEPKQFIDYKCKCSRKCNENVPVENRLAVFKNFHSLGSYIAQNMFIVALVKENPVKRHYVSTNKENISKNKAYSRQYFLDGTSVCRDMFVKTLQTTPKRINTSLCKMRSGVNITDNRGVQAGHNKVDPESEKFVINIIKKLPTYVSHYRREQCEGAKFLRPDMTFSKIYELYRDEAETKGVQTLSYSKVYKIFLTKFNLRTKPLKKDTCNKCDYLNSKKINASLEEKAEIEVQLKAHLDKAKSLQTKMKSDMALAKNDPSVETISFDLEKTLPLPRIPTNIVFYKRQLWVYNLGIHTGSNDEAHCNVWVEGEAGRGAQEVGSCLIKHILERVEGNVKRLILWSDSCGGQNRNIKLVLMLKAMLNEHPTIDQIHLRFLESGHSFLPNDTDFGKIECALKLQQRIYTPEDYMQVMRTCKKKNPMHVHRMKSENFLSTFELEKNITNRKKTVDGDKVSWLNTKEIILKKEKMFTIFMRSDLNDLDYKEVNIKKNIRGRQNFNITKNIMKPLWPNGKPIPEPKLKDLKSLLHLILQDSHHFYVKLVGDNSIEDDLEGFSGLPDFEIEESQEQ